MKPIAFYGLANLGSVALQYSLCIPNQERQIDNRVLPICFMKNPIQRQDFESGSSVISS